MSTQDKPAKKAGRRLVYEDLSPRRKELVNAFAAELLVNQRMPMEQAARRTRARFHLKG